MAKCCENNAKFDGISDDYKRRLWIVIALNAAMFIIEMGPEVIGLHRSECYASCVLSVR